MTREKKKSQCLLQAVKFCRLQHFAFTALCFTLHLNLNTMGCDYIFNAFQPISVTGDSVFFA